MQEVQALCNVCAEGLGCLKSVKAGFPVCVNVGCVGWVEKLGKGLGQPVIRQVITTWV